jgi:hypothetical protein
MIEQMSPKLAPVAMTYEIFRRLEASNYFEGEHSRAVVTWPWRSILEAEIRV